MARMTFPTAVLALAIGGVLAGCSDMMGNSPSATGAGSNTSTTAPDTSSSNPSSTNSTSPSGSTSSGSQNPSGPGPHG
jgi:hypothetical protein